MVDAAPLSAGQVFPGQDEAENIRFIWREHPIRLIAELIVPVGGSLPLLFGCMLAFMDPPLDPLAGRVIVIVASLIAIAAHLWFLSHIYRHYLRMVIVTNRRIHSMKKTLFTRDDQRSIEFPILRNIRKHQRGIPQNIFGYGTLILETPETTLSMRFVPKVAAKLEAIMQLRDENRVSPVQVLEKVQEVVHKAEESEEA